MSYIAQIAGTGSYLPERLLTNHDLEKMVETSDEWILDRTGISTRHIAAPEQATSDLSYIAALQALESAGVKAEQLDGILVATVTSDYLMPTTACLLQARLGCRSIMALDISAACSGFVYGLCLADQMIRSGMLENVLVIGAETLSRIVDYQDRQTCILFGDGAGAAVVNRAAKGSSSRIFSSHLGASGAAGDLLTLVGGGSRTPFSQEVFDKKLHLIQMKGRELFKVAVRTMCDRATEALAANQSKIDDVDWVIVHQANKRIIEAVASQLGIDSKKILANIRDTGNTSSASISILFDQSVRNKTIKRGDTILMVAFGAGLTSGSVLLTF